jgi:uncharacterized protein with HEPN domain
MRLEARKPRSSVDDRLVWDVVEAKLPVLRREVEALLGED